MALEAWEASEVLGRCPCIGYSERMTDREARRVALVGIVQVARASMAGGDRAWTTHPDSRAQLAADDEVRVAKAAAAVLDTLERRANRNRSFGSV